MHESDAYLENPCSLMLYASGGFHFGLLRVFRVQNSAHSIEWLLTAIASVNAGQHNAANQTLNLSRTVQLVLVAAGSIACLACSFWFATRTMAGPKRPIYYHYILCVCMVARLSATDDGCKTNGTQFKRPFYRKKLPLTVIAHLNTRAPIYVMCNVDIVCELCALFR